MIAMLNKNVFKDNPWCAVLIIIPKIEGPNDYKMMTSCQFWPIYLARDPHPPLKKKQTKQKKITKKKEKKNPLLEI